MVKYLQKIVFLGIFLVSFLRADEFKAPLIAQQGPLQYSIGPKKEALVFKGWSVGYTRSFDKSFMSYGTHTKPLSALIFNSPDFKVSDAFTPGAATAATENFNAWLPSTRLYPRVSYEERGVNLGAQLEYPVAENNARIGVRMSVPFKVVRMERDDNAEASAAGNQTGYVLSDEYNATIPVSSGGSGVTPVTNGVSTKTVPVTSNLYKVSLVQNIPVMQSGSLAPVVTQDSSHNITIVQQPYDATVPTGFNGVQTTNNIPYAVFLAKDINQMPNIANRAVKLDSSVQAKLPSSSAASDVFIAAASNTSDESGTNYIARVVMDSGNITPMAQVKNYSGSLGVAAVDLTTAPLQELPTSYDAIQEGTLYTFGSGKANDYLPMLSEHGDTLWFMTVNNTSGQVQNTAIDSLIQSKLNRYASQSSEQWLWSSGYQFNTNQRMGFGDLDIDLFYEHALSHNITGEVSFGLRIPTESAVKNDGNPYKVILGGNGHYGLKVGALGAWLAMPWLSLKADANYIYTLKATEQRFGAFSGATIKNMGPSLDVEVKFGTFVGHLDATFYHIKSNRLSVTVGYEFKYKAEDDVYFKQATYDFGAHGDTWFGKLYDATTKAYGANVMTLSNDLAKKNTESIGHKIRFEANVRLHKYISLFAGGAYTVIGKNAPQDRDAFFGIKAWF